MSAMETVPKVGKRECEKTCVHLGPSHSPVGSGLGPLNFAKLRFVLGHQFLRCGFFLFDRLAILGTERGRICILQTGFELARRKSKG